ncbi:unnamed protein product [Dicrocoelium dendriticum]|nr:unnamed protein product [Dicrocoelium dendriticum]
MFRNSCFSVLGILIALTINTSGSGATSQDDCRNECYKEAKTMMLLSIEVGFPLRDILDAHSFCVAHCLQI